MKQAVKATVLILLVSLLSGCSSAEEKACEAAAQARAEYETETKELWDKKQEKSNASLFFEALDLDKQAKETYAKSQRVIANNPNCFTPKQVVEAQTYILKIK
jgi:uncharacterized protein YceK